MFLRGNYDINVLNCPLSNCDDFSMLIFIHLIYFRIFSTLDTLHFYVHVYAHKGSIIMRNLEIQLNTLFNHNRQYENEYKI